MEIPSKIKVACFDIKISKWDHIEGEKQNMYGRFSCIDQSIQIDESINSIKMIDTLLHELSHAIYWAYGIEDEDKEERVVSTFATAWTQIYRDNPKLLKFIVHTLEVA